MTDSKQGFGLGVVYVLLANLGWSLSGLFVRLMPGLSGWQINCWRGFWMAVALLCYAVVMHGRETGRIFNIIPRFAMFWSAVCFAVGTTLYVTSLTLNTTAAVSVIGATSPLFTGLLSPWITGEKPGILNWLATLIALLSWLLQPSGLTLMAATTALFVVIAVWEWGSFHGGWLEPMERRGWWIGKVIRARINRRRAERLAREAADQR